jgi:hypothetical protein
MKTLISLRTLGFRNNVYLSWGEGRIEGRILKEVQAYDSNGDELNKCLFDSCGDMNNPSLAMVNVLGRRLRIVNR